MPASLALMIDAAVKATILLALAAVIARLSRRASASFRHLIWALGLGGTLCLPLLSWALPHWSVAIIRSPPARYSHPVASDTVSSPDVNASRSVPGTPPPVYPLPPSHLPWSAWTLLTGIWGLGAAIVLIRRARGIALIRALERVSVPLVDGPLADTLARVRKEIPVHRPIALRRISVPDRVTAPLTWGAWRPVIVLPSDATDWPEERLRAALLHELGHISRRDWLVQIQASMACALYWFHPLVWFAARRMRMESEAACDDMVLLAGMPAADYARHLLDVALGARLRRGMGSGVVAMAETTQIEGRLKAVLAEGVIRRPPGVRQAMSVSSAAFLLVLPLAALRPASGAPTASAAVSPRHPLGTAHSISAKSAPSVKAIHSQVRRAMTQKRHIGTKSVKSAPRTSNLKLVTSRTAISRPVARTVAQLPHPASPPPALVAPKTADGDAEVVQAQEQLRRVTAGYRAGVNSSEDVDTAAAAVSEARIRSAVSRDQLTDLGPDLDSIVKLRQQSLETAKLKFNAGLFSASDVNKAEVALAEARVRADLYAVVTARRAGLDNATARYQAGVSTVQERDGAAAAFQEAQRRFLESGRD